MLAGTERNLRFLTLLVGVQNVKTAVEDGPGCFSQPNIDLSLEFFSEIFAQTIWAHMLPPHYSLKTGPRFTHGAKVCKQRIR